MNKLLTVSIVLASVAITQADSLEERKYWKSQQKNLDSSLEKVAKNCDGTFTFDWIDKPTFREEATKNKNSPYSICASMVDQVASLCREGEDEKSSVKAKIKGFECGFADPRTAEITGAGILKYLGNHKQPNFSAWAKPWLMKQL